MASQSDIDILNVDSWQSRKMFDQIPEQTNQLDFARALNILKKWSWFILLSIVITLGLAALIVFRLAPVYSASSTLEIKQQERKIFSESDIAGIVVDDEFFSTMVELIKSRTLAESVVNNLNLASDPEFVSQDQDRSQRMKSAITKFVDTLRVKPIGASRLISVTFEHTDPRTTSDVVNSISDTFISNNLDRKFNATAYAREFIEEQLSTTKKTLENSERALARYATDNRLVTVRDNNGEDTPGLLTADALVILDAELIGARTKRLESERRYNLSQENSALGNPNNSAALAELKRQHYELNSTLIEQSARYLPTFPPVVDLQNQVDLLSEQIKEEESNLGSFDISNLKTEYEIALAKEADLQSRVNSLKNSVTNIRAKSVEYNILKREVQTNSAQYDALLQRLKDVSISDDLDSDLVVIVDRAQPPVKPIRPKKLLLLLLAGGLGGVLGLSIVALIELLDDKIKSPEQVKNHVTKVIMGVTPIVKNIKNREEMLLELTNSHSSIAEAYASFRTNIQLSGPNGGPRIIHLTSSESGEGKSISSLGLALRFAGIGGRTLLIDADLRLPTFNRNAKDSIGLSGLLTTNEHPKDHIIETRFDNLDLLISGSNVPNPSEILSTYKMDEILEYARGSYEHIIIDSPPVMGLADALILGAKADATILMIKSGAIRVPVAKQSIEKLLNNNAKVLGAAITSYQPPTRGYYSYYNYAYGEKSSSYGKGKSSNAKADQGTTAKKPLNLL